MHDLWLSSRSCTRFDSLGHYAEGRESHCYFKKQPETPQEIDQAVDAINGSCCGAVRYAGSDPEIIQKLKDVGCEDAIDRC